MPYPDFRGCLKSLSASPEPLKHKASGVMTYKRTTGAGFCLAEDRSRRTSKAERYSTDWSQYVRAHRSRYEVRRHVAYGEAEMDAEARRRPGHVRVCLSEHNARLTRALLRAPWRRRTRELQRRAIRFDCAVPWDLAPSVTSICASYPFA